LGATYNEVHVGTFGDIATCSFYPAHHITMGEGGAVVFKTPELFNIGNSIRDWGRECKCKGKVPVDGLCRNRFNYKISVDNEDIHYDHRYVYTDIGYLPP
jgi:CDP-6-deoxy-D-xylo-4-hexulose-3-dehydrase